MRGPSLLSYCIGSGPFPSGIRAKTYPYPYHTLPTYPLGIPRPLVNPYEHPLPLEDLSHTPLGHILTLEEPPRTYPYPVFHNLFVFKKIPIQKFSFSPVSLAYPIFRLFPFIFSLALFWSELTHFSQKPTQNPYFCSKYHEILSSTRYPTGGKITLFSQLWKAVSPPP